MKKTVTQKRVEWLKKQKTELEKLPSADHSSCRGNCKNGRTCDDQSSGGWGYWARALAQAGIDAQPKKYWSGSLPTPSTSIRRVIAQYILSNCPEDLL